MNHYNQILSLLKRISTINTFIRHLANIYNNSADVILKKHIKEVIGHLGYIHHKFRTAGVASHPVSLENDDDSTLINLIAYCKRKIN